MAADAALRATLSLDASQYQRAMADASRTTDNAADKISKSQASIAKGFAQVGLAAATAGALIGTAFIVKATRTFIDFEHSVTRTAAIMKITVEQIKPVEEEILRVAAASSFTATQVGEAAQVLALAGLEMSEMIDDKAIENLVKFAILAGTDVETAAGIALSATKGFRLEIAEMDRVMNTMVNTFTSSFTTLETLGMALKFLGPTASAAGVSIEEASAAVGALGNAGLQGTLAGTGLRMAINKLLTPTDEARKTMQRLGLDVMKLTPAGQEAQAALTVVTKAMDATKQEALETGLEIDRLEGKLSDLSIEQQRNSIAIARIRQRAARQGRELTKEEIAQIERLETANEDLSIQQSEASLEAQIARRKQDRQNRTISEQTDEYTRLRDIVQSQTEGITGLVDVVDQLNTSMATVTEILQIFGVRGGTAVLALQSQTDAFKDMTQANKDAQISIEGTGTQMDVMLDTVTSDTQYALDLVRSNFEDAFIAIGAEFAPLIFESGGLRDSLIAIAQQLKSDAPNFRVFAGFIKDDILPAMMKLPGMFDELTDALTRLGPLLRFIGNVAKLVIGIFMIIADIIGWIARQVDRLFSVLEKAANFLGIDTGEKSRYSETSGVMEQTVTGAATGAAIGASLGLLGGPFAPITVSGGAAGGAIIGGLAGFAGEVLFEKGGIATSPTPGIFGEAGAEALIPLNDSVLSKLGDSIAAAQSNRLSSQSGSVNNFHFGSITINGDSNLSAQEVERIIEKNLITLMKKSMFRGSRGTF